MTSTHLKVLISTLTDRILELEKELRIKEWSINNLQEKLKGLEKNKIKR